MEDDGRFSMKLDGGRTVSFGADEFRHLDYGYAVADHPLKGNAASRLLAHVEAGEQDGTINGRMQPVAQDRFRGGARVYTDDADAISNALDRNVERQFAADGAMTMRKAGPGLSSEMSGVASVEEAEHLLSQGIEMGMML